MARPHPTLSVRTVESVLDSVRRELSRDPRRRVEVAVKQLLSLARRPGADRAGAERTTYRVDDLARVSGVTVRNIRAYQEKGLLPPPERRGRVAYFDDNHRARLRIITSMLERGYTTAHISEMLAAWESGRDLADVLGLERALIAPAAEPRTLSRAEATALAGGRDGLARMAAAGLVETSSRTVRVARPDLLEAFAEMRGYGVPIEQLVDLHESVSTYVDQITQLLVEPAVQLLGPRFASGEPTSAQVGELVDLLTRFRLLAITTVTATLEDSVESTVEELLSTYLAGLLSANAGDAVDEVG